MSFRCILPTCTTPEVIHRGRGLCERCYEKVRRRGELVDYPRVLWARDELLDEWDHFTKDRPTHRQNVRAFAEHLGRPFPSVEKSLSRAGIRAARPANAPRRAAS